jgi:hypothetical protein
MVRVVAAVKVPEVPVMVMVAVPVLAVLLAVKVRVLVEVAGSGVKAAVTPLGKPDAVRATLLLKPLTGVMVRALVTWPPTNKLNVLGLVESLKLGGAAIVRLRVVVSVRVPAVPVTVMVALPVVAVALAVRVKVLVEVAAFGLKAAVTPAGKPEADRLTLLLKPLPAEMVIVLVPWLP